MTDTMPVGPGAGPLTPDISTNIPVVTNAAPELSNDPGTAVSVASTGGNLPLKAQAVAQAGKRQAIATAHDSLFGDLGHLASDVGTGATHLLSGVAHAANVGLATVQQEYRYLHDVEARHGLTAAMLEGAGILGAGIAGTVATGGDLEVGLLASEGAARLEGQYFYKDSWSRAANPNYRDPHTGQLVSFGRDVTSYLANKGIIGSSDHGVISGALDGLADLVADPLALGGKTIKGAQEGFGGPLGKVFTGLGGGDNPITGEMVDHARMVYPSYRRALRQIADMGPTEVSVKFPQFKAIATTLGDATTPDEVHEVFYDLAKSSEIVDSLRLPTMSLARTATGALHDMARNAGDGVLSDIPVVGAGARLVANNPFLGVRRWTDRLEALSGTTYDPATMDLSGSEINLGNTRGLRDIYALARYGNSDRVAKTVGDAWAAGTVAQRKVILRNLIFDTMFSVAKRKLPGTDEYVQALRGASSQDEIQAALDNRGDEAANYLNVLGQKDVVNAVQERFENHIDASSIDGVNRERQYGVDLMGKSIDGVEQNDGIVQAGITSNQTGPVNLPNLVEMRRMAAQIQSTKIHRVLARADDFLYDHVTQGFFKPLVLMSVGYGWHIALAEAIPNTLRDGVFRSAKIMYDRALTNLGIRAGEIGPGDSHALAGLLWHLGGERAFNHSVESQWLADYYVAHEMYRRPVGMAAGEVTSGEIHLEARAESGLRQPSAVPMRPTGGWTLYGDDNKRFVDEWHAWLRRNSHDRWTQTAAKSYLDAARGLPEVSHIERQTLGKNEELLSRSFGGPEHHYLPYDLYDQKESAERPGGLHFSVGGSHHEDFNTGVFDRPQGAHFAGKIDNGTLKVDYPGRFEGMPFSTAQALRQRFPEEYREWLSMGRDYLPSDRISVDQEQYLRDRGLLALGQTITSNMAQEVLGADLARKAGYHSVLMEGHDASEPSEYAALSSRAIRKLREFPNPGSKAGWEREAEQSRVIHTKVIDRPEVKPMNQAEGTEYARQAVKRQLESEPQDVLDNHVRSLAKRPHAPDSWDNLDDWAHTIVENMKGSVHQRPTGELDAAGKQIPGRANVDLLQSLANGHTPDLNELRDMPVEQRPLRVPGRVLTPTHHGLIQQIADRGFKKILDPMVNMVSRNQEFAVEYVKNMKALQAKVDLGIMSEDERMVQASQAATIHSMRFIHNLNDRTQWTATMRNWAPFFFAQEQAYRRMGRLLAEDPGAFRRYQMAITGAGNISAQMQDGSGNSYIVIPGTGFAAKGLADVMGLHGLTLGGVTPAVFGGSSSSANVIFPLSQGFKPDLGPVALVPMAGLGSMFEELGKSYPQYQKVTQVLVNDLQWVDGGSNTSSPLWEQLIPNAFVSHLVDAFNDGRAYQSSIMQAYQMAAYQQGQAVDQWAKNGRHGPMPQIIPSAIALQNNTPQAQAFVNKIKNWVRMLYIGRAITAFVSPISASTEINNFGFSEQLNKAIQKAGSVSIGMQNFLLEHPTAGSYTVAQSFAPTGSGGVSGVSLPTSEAGETWIADNQALIQKYGTAAYWLMPQLKDSKYSPSVYNEQIAQGIRVKDTPQQFLDQLYISAGDDQYYASLTAHEAALNAAGGSTVAKNSEYDRWNAYVAQLQAQNPIWARDFFSNTRQFNAKDAITGLQHIFADNAAPDTLQSQQVKYLLGNYEQAAAEYASAGQSSNYSHEQALVYDGWIQYLDAQETAVPALKPVINSVFKVALKPVS